PSPTGSSSFSASTVSLRGLSLPPGGTMTVLIHTVVCVSGTATWTATIKQSNDFNGPPGNDYVPDQLTNLTTTTSGSCHLAFVASAADAGVTANITSVAFTPAGARVEVDVLDDTNALVATTAPITLSIDSSSPNPGPNVTFSGTSTCTPPPNALCT